MDSPHEPLSRRMIGRLLDYIERERLRPGAMLPPEKTLVEALGVSRMVLREGLSHLKALGVITSRRGSGFRLETVDFVTVLGEVLQLAGRCGTAPEPELYELRRVLEIGLVADAVAAARLEDLEEIRAALTELESFTAVADAAAMARFSQAELRFHRALLRPAQCRTLSIIDRALAEFFQYRFARSEAVPQLSADQVRRTNLAHRAIAECFELRDGEAALSLLRRHLGPPRPQSEATERNDASTIK